MRSRLSYTYPGQLTRKYDIISDYAARWVSGTIDWFEAFKEAVDRDVRSP